MSRYTNKDAKAAACVEAVLRTLREHGFSLEHEDHHGGFLIVPGELLSQAEREENEAWLRGAMLDTEGHRGAAKKAEEYHAQRDAEEKAEFERVASALCGTSNEKEQGK